MDSQDFLSLLGGLNTGLTNMAATTNTLNTDAKNASDADYQIATNNAKTAADLPNLSALQLASQAKQQTQTSDIGLANNAGYLDPDVRSALSVLYQQPQSPENDQAIKTIMAKAQLFGGTPNMTDIGKQAETGKYTETLRALNVFKTLPSNESADQLEVMLQGLNLPISVVNTGQKGPDGRDIYEARSAANPEQPGTPLTGGVLDQIADTVTKQIPSSPLAFETAASIPINNRTKADATTTSAEAKTLAAAINFMKKQQSGVQSNDPTYASAVSAFKTYVTYVRSLGSKVPDDQLVAEFAKQSPRLGAVMQNGEGSPNNALISGGDPTMGVTNQMIQQLAQATLQKSLGNLGRQSNAGGTGNVFNTPPDENANIMDSINAANKQRPPVQNKADIIRSIIGNKGPR